MCTCTRSSVSISLESGVQCEVRLLVSYVVSCAAWSSSYDIRVFTKDKTMKVSWPLLTSHVLWKGSRLTLLFVLFFSFLCIYIVRAVFPLFIPTFPPSLPPSLPLSLSPPHFISPPLSFPPFILCLPPACTHTYMYIIAPNPLSLPAFHFLPPQLQYYGLIKQWTGEDWENASISLSTAQPSIGGSAPDLPTRIIRFWRPPVMDVLTLPTKK